MLLEHIRLSLLKVAHSIRFNHLQVAVLSTNELHRLVLYSTKPNYFANHVFTSRTKILEAKYVNGVYLLV